MVQNTKEKRAYVSEIFTSIQGEGLHVGKPYLFIRFAGCNLECHYCDTPRSRDKKYGKVLNLDQIICRIKRINHKIYKSVCLTGGEPLLYADFIVHLLPEIKKLGCQVSIETNGTLVKELKKVIHHLDILAVSIKPVSSGNRFSEKRYRDFLKTARFWLKLKKKGGYPSFFTKMIIDRETSESEVVKIARMLASVDKGIPLVLQPATSGKGVYKNRLIRLQLEATKYINDVRVIPQIHKILGIK